MYGGGRDFAWRPPHGHGQWGKADEPSLDPEGCTPFSATRDKPRPEMPTGLDDDKDDDDDDDEDDDDDDDDGEEEAVMRTMTMRRAE